MSQLNQTNKQVVWRFWQALESALPQEASSAAAEYLASDLVWHGPDPINDLHGSAQFTADFWAPLIHAFPDLKRETFIFMGGKSNGRIDGDISKDGHMWVSGTGNFHATFAHDYLGIPATGKPVSIRWGEFHRLEHARL